MSHSRMLPLVLIWVSMALALSWQVGAQCIPECICASHQGCLCGTCFSAQCVPPYLLCCPDCIPAACVGKACPCCLGSDHTAQINIGNATQMLCTAESGFVHCTAVADNRQAQ